MSVIARIHQCLHNEFDKHASDDRKSVASFKSNDDAVKSDNGKIVKELLRRHGADVNEVNKQGYTVLHVAVCQLSKNELSVIRSLVSDHGADVNARSMVGETALHFAARNQNCDFVRLLIGYKADVAAVDDQLDTALHFAVNAERMSPLNEHDDTDVLSVVQTLLDSGADLSAKNILGLEPTHFAVGNGLVDTMKLFIGNGADVNAVDRVGQTLLHLASFSIGNPYIVERQQNIAEILLKHGANINCATKLGQTPLHYATMNGNFGMVKILLQREADVCAVDIKGNTPLHVSTGAVEIVRLLIEHGAKLEAKNNVGQQPVHSAAQKGLAQLTELLSRISVERKRGCKQTANEQNGENPVLLEEKRAAEKISNFPVAEEGTNGTQEKDAMGKTPLHYSAEKLDWKITKFLLDSDASVNAVDNQLNTPLHLVSGAAGAPIVLDNAYVKSATSTAVTLLEYGANAELENADLCRPIHYASSSGLTELLELLIEKTPGCDVNVADRVRNTPLHLVISSKTLLYFSDPRHQFRAAELLTRRSANINQRNLAGSSPLHCAAQSSTCDRALFEFLLKSEASVGIVDDQLNTPLHLTKSVEQAQLLINYNADTEAENRLGQRPIHCATLNGSCQLVELLIERGATVNAKDLKQTTPTHIAASCLPDPLALRIVTLFKASAKVDVQDCFGKTPLHYAVATHKPGLVRFLLDMGARATVADYELNTPLHLVMGVDVQVYPQFQLNTASAISIAKMLLEKDADIDAENVAGLRPIHYAVRSGILDYVKLLLTSNQPTFSGVVEGKGRPENETAQKERIVQVKSADVTVADRQGDTPLHFSTRPWFVNSISDIVQILVEHGAVINHQNIHGQTALHYAVLFGNEEAQKAILQCNPDLRITDVYRK